METTEANYRTVEGIKTHPLYRLITTKQQQFLIAYIESSGDRAHAAEVAYAAAKPDLTGKKVLQSAYVRELIAAYYGYKADMTAMNKSELIGLISARLRRGDCPHAVFNSLADKLIILTSRKPKNNGGGRPKNSEREGIALEAVPEIDALVKQIEEEQRKTK